MNTALFRFFFYFST
ncbi:pheST operon leader peptide PheM [Salmonella enterica]|nr:pheST operon leader peptide PheM [Salmonella enterica]EDW4355690.1 pheST operon leader peptide PheM [Salmonella enterica subsp. salamae]HCM1882815.1 pheST operon leader peptide PheM [Salmonella enterica subsp. salamae serovar 60:z10:z39]EDS7877596.1 pheST operon leader peptide PheM [Salmonella enterica]EDX9484375.1 pheST operon leader peptide PheM [Salmonella enterica]